MNRKLIRLPALLAAAAVGFSMLPRLSASAAVQKELTGYYGDLTFDKTVDIEDVMLLSDGLTVQESMRDEQYERADLNHDGEVNAVDLTLLKRAAIGELEPEAIYTEIEVPDKLIDAPIRSLYQYLPSVGEANILMIAVDFPDAKHPEQYSAEQIHTLTFGDENKADPCYPLESISAYYTRSSYGRLHLNGDVYLYTAQKNIDDYINQEIMLLDEVLGALDAEIDYNRYNANGDMAIDTMLLALPPSSDPEFGWSSPFWPCSFGYSGRKTFDNLFPGNICMGRWALSDRAGFNSTWIHELGHAMGLPDYYYYENAIGNGDGLTGEAGYLMMDDSIGDMSAFDKLMLGWYAESEVQIYSGGTQTYQLDSSQHAPGCVIVPYKELNGYMSEYFVIENVTSDGNNASKLYGWGQVFPLFQKGGLRVMHCDSELMYNFWRQPVALKWNNYSPYYDNSNLKQRILRLVNDGKGFFRSRSVISNQTSGFAWYDAEGGQTVDPGVTIQVGGFENGICSFTISQTT